MGENLPVEFAFHAGCALLSAFVLVRYGIIAAGGAMFVERLFFTAPITLDPSVWYFGRSLAVLVLIMGLAGYAFHTALGQKPALAPGLLEPD
jgi:hypothetical protein